jgi:transcriptional repressor NrdR
MRVVKRDGRHEPLDRQKLLSSIVKACEKRPVGLDAIEAAVEEILQALEGGEEREVESRLIGAMVMEKLHGLDAIAYVRYASVYRQFQEIGDFLEEIQSLKRKARRSSAQPELFPA